MADRFDRSHAEYARVRRKQPVVADATIADWIGPDMWQTALPACDGFGFGDWCSAVVQVKGWVRDVLVHYTMVQDLKVIRWSLIEATVRYLQRDMHFPGPDEPVSVEVEEPHNVDIALQLSLGITRPVAIKVVPLTTVKILSCHVITDLLEKPK